MFLSTVNIAKRLKDYLWNRRTLLYPVIVVIVFLNVFVDALRFVDLDVPRHVITGRPVEFNCLYDLEGDELYSVKWYKGKQEFYRYLPKNKPPAHLFTIVGVAVDLDRSSEKTLMLNTVNQNSSGTYRCEVSAEAPSFQTFSSEREMLVIDLPKTLPKISGTKGKYLVGDTVHVNCTSGKSKPAPILTWLINGVRASREQLKNNYPIVMDNTNESVEYGLEQAVLGLEFRVTEDHFDSKGELKLTCDATISTIYNEATVVTVEGDTRNNMGILGATHQNRHSKQGISGTSKVQQSLTNLTLLLTLIALARWR